MGYIEEKSKQDLENWKTLYRKGLVTPQMINYVKLVYHFDLRSLDGKDKEKGKNGKPGDKKKEDKKNKKGNVVSREVQKKQLTAKKAAQQKLKKIAKKLRLKALGHTFKGVGKVCKVVGRAMQRMANVTERIAKVMKKAARKLAEGANKMMSWWVKSIGPSYGTTLVLAPAVIAAYGAMMGASAACATTSLAMFGATRALRTTGRVMETTLSQYFKQLGEKHIQRANSMSTNIDMSKVNQEVNQEMQQKSNENSNSNLLNKAKDVAGNAMEGAGGGNGGSGGNEGDKKSGNEFLDAAASNVLDLMKDKSRGGQKEDIRGKRGDATQVMSDNFVNRLKRNGGNGM